MPCCLNASLIIRPPLGLDIPHLLASCDQLTGCCGGHDFASWIRLLSSVESYMLPVCFDFFAGVSFSSHIPSLFTDCRSVSVDLRSESYFVQLILFAITDDRLDSFIAS